MGKRKAYTPFSTSSEAGVTAAPVEGFIDVTQEVRPTIDTGFVDSKGRWIGNVTSDSAFTIHTDGVEIANTGVFITPSVNPDGTWPLDMTGFNDLFLGIKVTNTGNYKIGAIMGPSDLSFANLSPVEPAVLLKGFPIGDDPTDMSNLMDDAAENIPSANTWIIFSIMSRMRNQKLLQFKITNNSGDISTIDTAFMRMV